MKKVSLVALVATLATAQGASADLGATVTGTCPKAFQGFHLGGNIGYGVGTAEQKYRRIIRSSGNVVDDNDNVIGTFSTVGIEANRNRLGIHGVDGGVNTGYTHRFGNWGLGLEFVANWANSKGERKEFFRFTRTGSSPLAVTAGVRHRAKLKNSLQLRGNFSYVVCNLWAPKIILGWDNSSWEQEYKEFVSGNIGLEPVSRLKKRERYNGFLWGAGIDFLATKHVIVGFEYTGTAAGRKKLSRTGTFVNADGDDVVTASRISFKPQYNKFALVAKVIY